MGGKGNTSVSELPKIRHEFQWSTPTKFAGLDPKYALARAHELLDDQAVAIYLEPLLGRGISLAEIAVVTSESIDAAKKIDEDLEVKLAEEHLKQSFGHSATILQLIDNAEQASGRKAYTDNSDNSTDRRQ